MSDTMIKVYKFGGTSVGSVEKIQAIADRALWLNPMTSMCGGCISNGAYHGSIGGIMLTEISTSPEPREYDALISTGENVSAALLSMSIIAKGGKANFVKWFSSWNLY